MGNEGFDCTGQIQSKQLHTSNIDTAIVSTTSPKKKRCLPGTPNPDAEVIALSPKTLVATNRFVCEVCSKGFQREQNLQLHRRGHNLPWKLKQKSNKEVRKKVYVCPEPTCVHHNPSRALSDRTGIKKHFCRKHGEKKWKCEKCSKKYAVQSDWKAHSKTCGTRGYRCDCGTLFSRRDSFITHRAFCDALAQERERLHISVPQQCNQQQQFDHLSQSSNPSLRSLQCILSSTLNQNFHDGSQSLNEFLGFSSNMPGQFPGNSNSGNPQSSFMYDLGFPSDKNQRNDSLLPAAPGLSLQNKPNSDILNDHLSESLCSLHTLYMKNNIVLPPMSAAALLLHKSTQMGGTATRSNNDPLFGGGGHSIHVNNMRLNWEDQRSSSSSSSLSFHMNNLDQTKDNFSVYQDQNQLQDIIGSMENGSVPNSLGSVFQTAGRQDGSNLGNLSSTKESNVGNVQSPHLCDSETLESTHHSAVSSLSLGGTNGLTRDFLGVGGRFLQGGCYQIDEGCLR